MSHKLKIVLVDSNSKFRDIMSSFAESRGLSLVCFDSVLAMGSISTFGNYDIAIVEKDKGTLSGVEVGEYLSKLLKDMPLILISSGMRPTSLARDSWPLSVKEFVHKNDGPDAIFDSALRYRCTAT